MNEFEEIETGICIATAYHDFYEFCLGREYHYKYVHNIYTGDKEYHVYYTSTEFEEYLEQQFKQCFIKKSKRQIPIF